MRSGALKLWMSLGLLMAVLAVALPLTGLLGWKGDAWFPVRWVKVSGPLQRVSAEQVRGTVAPLLEGGLLRLSVREARAALEALPWVERAEVRKQWPGTLEVRVNERTALARWGDDRLITPAGEAFAAAAAPALGDMPQLSGPVERQQELVAFYRATLAEAEALRLRLVAAHVSPGGSVTVTLEDGAVVVLGSGDALERWERFLKALPSLRQQAAGRELERVDLRYPHGIAVRWRRLGDAALPVIAATPPLRAPADARPL